MKVVDLVNFSGEMLKQLHGFGIKIDDYKYLEMYKEYMSMKDNGYKTVYIVAKISEKYNVSERFVYKLLRHFGSDCKNRAV